MGTILAGAIVDKLQADLVDPNERTWSRADLLEDLNEALRATCELKLDAYVISEVVQLDPGDEQVLPVNGVALLKLGANSVSKRAAVQVDLELLDAADPDWASRSQATDVRQWIADPRDKRRFRVDPPNNGNGAIWGTYAATPDAITEDDPIPVGDGLEPALVQRALSAAYRRNTQRQDLAKTTGYEQQWMTMLGLSAKGQLAAAPKVAQSAGLN